jgi:hypothetical protein
MKEGKGKEKKEIPFIKKKKKIPLFIVISPPP